MKKKAKRKIAITLVLLFIATSVFLIFNFSGVLQTILPPAGCDFIKNTNEPTSSYTETLNSGIFTCDTERCIVSGSMKLSNPTATPKVVFRSQGDYDSNTFIAIDTDGDGILESYKRTSTSGGTGYSGIVLPFKSPEGYTLTYISYRKEVWVYYSGFKSYGFRLQYGADLSSTPKYSCQEIEVCDVVPSYEAKFNFCPSNDVFFPYCQGDKNSVTSTEVGRTFYTEEKEILKGERISFDPKYDSGESVAEKFIRIKKYDCSCLPAVEDGTACSSNQVKCKPDTTICPNNYVFKSSTYCYFLDGSSSRPRTTINNICTDNGGKYAHCERPTNPNNVYQKCDGTQPINQATCGAFTSSLYSCPTGQQCYVTATGKTGEGIGGCRCSDDKCILGQKIKGNSPTTYQECITIGDCVSWSSERTCASGLVFDILSSDCVCSPTTSCVPQSSECVGDLIRNCIVQNLGDKICYNWDSSAKQCPGNLKCDSLGTSDKDDVCSCKNIETCNSGEIKCTSLTEYDICSKDPNDINSCLTFRDLGNTVGEFQQCINNQITQREDIGCAFGTSSSVCSTKKDINGVLIEQCINNQCVSPTDQYTATESDFLNQRTKCFGNEIKKVVKYEGNKLISYRWETKTDVKYSTLGVCGEDYICIEYLSGQAQCSISAEFVGILTESSYGINTKINNVTVSITDNVPNRANMGITARLLEGETELKRVNTFTDTNGMVTVNFNYASPRTGELKIEVIAGDPAGVNFKQTKIIKIDSTLDLKLTCPVQGFVDRIIQCSWRVEDADTNKLVTAIPKIIVQQGGVDISYVPMGTTGISFMAKLTGNVDIIVKVEKEGYIGDIQQLSVPIQETAISQVFNVDNKDFFTYVGLGIDTGTHQLQLIMEETSQPISVQNIDASIRTPSGEIVPLTFNEIGEGDYKTNYNFQQSGTTYRLSGTVYFEDLAKESLPFEYSIVTLGGVTEKEKSNINLLIIGGGVAFFVILIIVGFLLLRRKR